MNIIDERCTGCAGCLKYCPMKAISIVERKARIDHDRCAECDLCYRIGVCPSKAFAPDQDLPWPRSIRSILSNPLTEFKETGVTGRGTEEMKTNEVTDRFKEGFLGICIDVGRPNVGARLRDVEVITRAVAPLGVAFEEKNPVTYLMVDKKTGRLNPEVLNEAVVSAVVEFVIPEALLANILASLRDCASKVDTVFSVGVISRVTDDGKIPALDLLHKLGSRDKFPRSMSGSETRVDGREPDLGSPVFVRPDCKVNVGLGRKS